ncbi:MAG: DUF4982 domain-containing protein, partial [Sedimentisphaerales bacterium]|nr:DUF4982 domain-containing protein [Sedimentisphaerales bacterium]
IDETFDMWVRSKRPNDYHRHFKEWWQKDTQAMLLRDRNHPSVIMWSIGNEINERADTEGLEIAREMTDYIHAFEPTRPVTQAICFFWDHPEKKWDDSAPAFAILDVAGYNYLWYLYAQDHQKYPQRIIVGLESHALQAFENWQMVEQNPYVIGDFVWTGMDYLGEAGIGHSTYHPAGEKPEDQFHQPWPWYIAWCGDIDILGHKKPQSYFRDVVWGESRLEMAVHEPIPDGMVESVFYWGWPREEKNWNWPGSQGQKLQVSVYSDYPAVRLELNGKVIAEKAITEQDMLKAAFMVPCEPGELKAVGMENGKDMETRTIRTTGPATGLRVSPERTQIKADRGEIVYVDIDTLDKEANIVPDAELPVTITVSGPGELIAAGNASPFIEGSLQDPQCNTFRGKALAIIRSTGQSGKIVVEVQSDNLESAKTSITAK